jgi:predicted nucleic acid-binding protein
VRQAVVDASVAVKWVVEEAGSDRAAGLLDGRTLHVPALLHVEAATALRAMARRGAVAAEAATAGVAWLVRAPLKVWGMARLVEPALVLATELGHPVYDCVYLALAVELGVPVVTADAGLMGVTRGDADIAQFVVPLGSIEVP